jgi:predicted GIY-YIG superfamily endonuclease
VLTPAELPTGLYRHFDADGLLLYVGISSKPPQRLAEHARGSDWAKAIARVTIEWFETREAALAAEANAIRDEAPIFNLALQPGEKLPRKPRPKPQPRKPEWAPSPAHVAARFGVSIGTVARWCKAGMPRQQISAARYRYDLTAIAKWLA